MTKMVNALCLTIVTVMMSGPAFASAGCCNPIAVPEPSSLTILAAALAAGGIGLFLQKRFRRSGRIVGLLFFVAAAATFWATTGVAGGCSC